MARIEIKNIEITRKIDLNELNDEEKSKLVNHRNLEKLGDKDLE